MNILIINCGSSSLKFQLINSKTEEVLAKGVCERIGIDGVLVYQPEGGEKTKIEKPMPTHLEAIQYVVEALTDAATGVVKSLDEIGAVGHRIVHGGEKFTTSALITEEVIKAVEECNDLAPLHNPANLIGIEACGKLMPNTPMVGVFDTAFHQTMPEHAYLYALPYDYYSRLKVRRYGFHGTSHGYVARQAARILSRQEAGFNVITCHLGNGSSISAVKDGKCVDTSMGLTPLAGVMMGTRSGDVDPAILPYLAKQTGMGMDELDAMLNRKSGLFGICGLNDMRDLHAARNKGDAKAQLAFTMFCHSIRKYIGAYYAVLGRVDALIFTAGIGENDDLARAGICENLEELGITIDPALNAVRSGKARAISREEGKVRVLVIPTNEELAIAESTVKVLGL